MSKWTHLPETGPSNQSDRSPSPLGSTDEVDELLSQTTPMSSLSQRNRPHGQSSSQSRSSLPQSMADIPFNSQTGQDPQNLELVQDEEEVQAGRREHRFREKLKRKRDTTGGSLQHESSTQRRRRDELSASDSSNSKSQSEGHLTIRDRTTPHRVLKPPPRNSAVKQRSLNQAFVVSPELKSNTASSEPITPTLPQAAPIADRTSFSRLKDSILARPLRPTGSISTELPESISQSARFKSRRLSQGLSSSSTAAKPYKKKASINSTSIGSIIANDIIIISDSSSEDEAAVTLKRNSTANMSKSHEPITASVSTASSTFANRPKPRAMGWRTTSMSNLPSQHISPRSARKAYNASSSVPSSKSLSSQDVIDLTLSDNEGISNSSSPVVLTGSSPVASSSPLDASNGTLSNNDPTSSPLPRTKPRIVHSRSLSASSPSKMASGTILSDMGVMNMNQRLSKTPPVALEPTRSTTVLENKKDPVVPTRSAIIQQDDDTSTLRTSKSVPFEQPVTADPTTPSVQRMTSPYREMRNQRARRLIQRDGLPTPRSRRATLPSSHDNLQNSGSPEESGQAMENTNVAFSVPLVEPQVPSQTHTVPVSPPASVPIRVGQTSLSASRDSSPSSKTAVKSVYSDPRDVLYPILKASSSSPLKAAIGKVSQLASVLSPSAVNGLDTLVRPYQEGTATELEASRASNPTSMALEQAFPDSSPEDGDTPNPPELRQPSDASFLDDEIMNIDLNARSASSEGDIQSAMQEMEVDAGSEEDALPIAQDDTGLNVITYDMQRLMLKPKSYRKVREVPDDIHTYMSSLDPLYLKTPNARLIFETMMMEASGDNEIGAPLIRVFNSVDTEETSPPFEFLYSNEMWYDDDVVPPDYDNVQGCGCEGVCDPKNKDCTCVRRQESWMGEPGYSFWPGFAYNNDGTLKEAGDVTIPVFECNWKCGCGDTCPNRVVQNGRKIKINLRKTETKGWGVFNDSATIPRGTFVGIYAGEFITSETGETRGKVYDASNRTYLFDIDFWHLHDTTGLSPSAVHHEPLTQADLDRWGEDDNIYCVDAMRVGNFTRFLNHSCDPNCMIHAVYVDDADLQKPLFCIFTRKAVKPWEELCFSYHGIDSDDEDEEIATGKGKKGKDRKGKGKQGKAAKVAPVRDPTVNATRFMKCMCGEAKCVGILFK